MGTKEQNQRHYAKHKARIAARTSRNYFKCTEASRVRRRNRAARLKGATGKFTYAQWLDVKSKQNHLCALCGLSLPLTIDHIKAVSKGGSNDITNIQALCWPCNQKKRNH